MKRKLIILSSCLSCIFMFNSCATIITGSSPKVLINGDVKEPVTIITSYKTYEKVKLPTQVQLNRKHLDGQVIKVESENYDFSDIIIQKSVNEWTFGNIAVGGLIGWGVDLLTNGVSRPSKKEYFVKGELKKEQGQ